LVIDKKKCGENLQLIPANEKQGPASLTNQQENLDQVQAG
jgi:hypothetical protein